jgi:rhamnulose-1-phosphate aldolase
VSKIKRKESILDSFFVKEMIRTTSNMYRLGWDERNGGNISYLLKEEEVSEYLDLTQVKKTIEIGFDCSELAGNYFIVTGSGKYFKNVEYDPEDSLGIIRIGDSGKKVELLWGFNNDGAPTSELPSHLMSHISRLRVNTQNRIVMHCHASHLLAMTYTHSLDEKAFTKKLWKMSTECVVVFPEGIGVIPWIVPGTNEIGEATAQKMSEYRLVVWPHHGIYGTGKDMDETFGLIETAEKAAQIYTLAQAQGGIKQTITDEQLIDLAKGFNVVPREGYLNR